MKSHTKLIIIATVIFLISISATAAFLWQKDISGPENYLDADLLNSTYERIGSDSLILIQGEEEGKRQK